MWEIPFQAAWGFATIHQAACGFAANALPVLLDAAIKSVIVLTLAGLTALMRRKASAAARHLVWLAGVVCLLILPVYSAVLPGVKVWRPPFNLTPTGSVTSGVATSVAMSAPRTVPGTGLGTNTPDMPAKAGTPSYRPDLAPSTPSVIRHPQSVISPVSAWPLYVLLAWLGGAAVCLLPVVVGWLALFRLEWSAKRVEHGPWKRMLDELRAELGVKRRVTLLQGDARATPMTWGAMPWRPAKILIPSPQASESASEPARVELPDFRRRIILLHELAHIKRRDCLAQLLARLTCALYWFNPLAWLAARRMVIERERACDDLVLTPGMATSVAMSVAQVPGTLHMATKVATPGAGLSPILPHAYAEQLVRIASTRHTPRLPGTLAIAMARPSTLERRIRMILDPQRSRKGVTRLTALTALLIALAVLLPLAMLHAGEPSDAASADSRSMNNTQPSMDSEPGRPHPRTRRSGETGEATTNNPGAAHDSDQPGPRTARLAETGDAQRPAREADAPSTKADKPHEAKTGLDFRIAPTEKTLPRILEGKHSGMGEQKVKVFVDTAKKELAANGPGQLREIQPSVAWFPVTKSAGDLAGGELITATHAGQRYVLLANREPFVMLSGQNAAWRVLKVQAAQDAIGRPAIQLTLDKAGAKRIAKLSEANLHRPLAMLVNGKVLSAPTLQSKISDTLQIVGSFTAEEARNLVNAIKQPPSPGWTPWKAAANGDRPAKYAWRIAPTQPVRIAFATATWEGKRPPTHAGSFPPPGQASKQPRDLVLSMQHKGDKLAVSITEQNASGKTTMTIEFPFPKGTTFRMRSLPSGKVELDSDRYQTLWVGQWRRDGKAVKTIRFLACAVGPNDAAKGFLGHPAENFEPIDSLPKDKGGFAAPAKRGEANGGDARLAGDALQDAMRRVRELNKQLPRARLRMLDADPNVRKEVDLQSLDARLQHALVQEAKLFVKLLPAGKFAQAAAMFSPDAKKVVPEAEMKKKLEATWQKLTEVGGKFQGVTGTPRVTQGAVYEVVYLPASWEHNLLDLKVVFDKEGRVSGLWTVAPGQRGHG